ncbi:phosphate signaling complex protein PhoU [Alphaproteobacteria bacterium KMM 3653]|uniref:Phosphate-specific transport system accessory protein PhoU n=1 Tax=Harenicola maris TaxID=2841044 RepID=A0AAP2CM80_9RHOB|nr:phosphate signaling complex protein PhoU [Harenicola maris]
MQDQHIASAFDRDLEAIQALLMRMGGMVETAVLDAARSLDTRDEELASEVRANDKAIDALEEEINQEVARLLALRSPVGRDLRTALSVMKIAANLERVGDYAKNMAKRTSVLANADPVEGSTGALRRMSMAVVSMLKDALDAFITRNEVLAEDVRVRDEDVDQMYNGLFREFLTYMMENPGTITACMHLHFIAKNTERMGDHVTNIAEQVVYLSTGELPDESRTKMDQTSLAVEPS